LFYYKAAEKYFTEINNYVGLGLTYNNMGSLFISLNQLDSSIYYLLKGISNYELANQREGLTLIYNKYWLCFF
jgi:hypothetical protein